MDKTRGYVRNWRAIDEWQWYTMPNHAHVFQHMIRRANRRNAYWRGILVRRGQFISSQEILATECGVGRQTIRTIVTHLSLSGEIRLEPTGKSTSLGTIITICNYDTYQAPDEEANQTVNQEPTKSQPTANQEPTSNENPDNPEKKNTTTTTTAREPISQNVSEVVRLWNSAVPTDQRCHRDGTPAIDRAYSGLVLACPPITHDEIVGAVENYRLALAVPNTQAHEHTLGSFLRPSIIERYLSGNFNLANYDKTKFQGRQRDGPKESDEDFGARIAERAKGYSQT